MLYLPTALKKLWWVYNSKCTMKRAVRHHMAFTCVLSVSACGIHESAAVAILH